MMAKISRRGLLQSWLALTLIGGSALAQFPGGGGFDIGPFPLTFPEGQVGVAYQPQQDEFQRLLTEALADAPELSLTVSTQGNLPPGITVSGAGLVSGVPTAAGSFSFRIIYRISATVENRTLVYRFLLDGTIVIKGEAGGLGIRAPELSFSAVRGGTANGPFSIVIENKGTQPRSISASATSRSSNWLSASGGGTIAPFSSAQVTVSASPDGLDTGIYQESVRIEADGGPEAFEVPATLTVTGTERGFSLSQNGLSFEVGQGSTVALTQSFGISAQGPGTQQFTATAAPVSGGSWLSVTPASGDIAAGPPVTAQVRINPTGLAAGQYHGQVQVHVDGAANTPQVVNAVLNVLPASAVVAPLVTPSGLIFVQSRSGTTAPHTISITNVSARAAAFSTVNGFDGPVPNWFSARTPSPTVNPGQTVTMQVQREGSVRLPAGVHTGEVRLIFGATSRRVAVVLIVLPEAANTTEIFSRSAPAADGCTAAKLIPVFTTLGAGFSATAGWPSAIEMRVVDDCGDPVTRGSVSVSFTNGDPPLSLQAFADGRWTGTWQPRSAAPNLILEAAARDSRDPALTGTARITGSASANATTPVIRSGGVLNSASRASRTPLTPGGAVSILGSALASSASEASELPLPSDLAGTQVLLGTRRLALRAADGGRIEAVIPYGVPENASQQLVVRRGNTISMPESVSIAAAFPAIYTREGSGSGEAVAIAIKADGSQVPVSADAPVAIGEEVIIACTGLGPVDPAVDAGTAAPEDPRAQTINPVTVTVGGVPAEITFSGLTPGLAGVYQINARLPDGIEPGPAVQVVVSAAGHASNPVTIAVQPRIE